ncbi:MAG: alginate O-acetyltransferase AlgX-related protein [Pirellulales bacterium]
MARTKSANVAVVAGFLTAIFSAGTIQAVLDLRQGKRPQALDVFTRVPTVSNLRAYEDKLQESSWVAARVRPWMQYAQFVLLKNAGDKALVGRDGWFFYKPGVEYLTQRQPPVAAAGAPDDPLAAIVAFRDQLAARGIRLLVVPVPNKESVYPEMLSPRAAQTEVAVCSETRALLSRLKASGVEVVDLFALFAATKRASASPALYLAQDTHWSPAGAELTARFIARQLTDRGWIGPGSAEYGQSESRFRRLGDVLRMLRVPQIERYIEPEEILATRVLGHAAGVSAARESDSQVLVLGDSFLRIFEQDEPREAGFLAHLARELKQPLASIVSDGGASTLVRQDLYRRPGLLANKKVVVWEFVERDIRFGAEGWQIIDLPPRL